VTYKYAVIIPHYNDVARLDRCLDVLVNSPHSDCEIVVADNMSSDPMDEIRARYPMVRFIEEPEKGAAMARNRGVAETSAPVLFFIDADCVPAPDWFLTATRVCGNADLIGGRVDVFDETPPPRSGAEALEAVFAFNFRTYVEKQGFAGSGNLLTRREVFADVGGFVHGLSEDLDWCHRARAKGYRLIYEDRLCVSHPSRQDWAALRRKWHRLTEELYGVNGSTLRARLRWAIRALAMPLSAVVHTPKILFSRKLSSAGERWRGVVTLFRLRLLRAGWMLRQALGLAI